MLRGEAGLIAQAERLAWLDDPGRPDLWPASTAASPRSRAASAPVSDSAGGGLRQPVHADDIARAVVACIATGAASARVLEIGGGERLPYHAMFRRVHASWHSRHWRCRCRARHCGAWRGAARAWSGVAPAAGSD
jgi:uncharacterized protein YbjT (DUF2867 family)